MSSAALSTAGRFPVRRKRPNRPTVDNALRLLASTERVPVQLFFSDQDLVHSIAQRHQRRLQAAKQHYEQQGITLSASFGAQM